MRFASDALSLGVLGSRRLLALAGDEALVEQMRRGNEAAFEVAFDRYGAQILGFCRHMLGSTEEAEDVVQHTFAAAFRDLALNAHRTVALKPWLYTIARNRCVSVLRARREQTAVPHEPSTIALADEVERRAEVQELLEDMLELPEDQRAALLLSQGGALSHAEVAEVLGCETAQVKGLVFRARTALIQRREARETPCASIREQLANLRGGALRRTELRHHLRECPGCRAFREHVRQQRRLLGALPLAPSLALKASVLGGSAGGGGGLAAAIGAGTLSKVAVAGVIACGGTVVVVEAERQASPPAREASAVAAPPKAATSEPEATTAPRAAPVAITRRQAGRRAEPRAARTRAAGRRRTARRNGPAPAAERPASRGRAKGLERASTPRASTPSESTRRAAGPTNTAARGRGPVVAPTAGTPVRRGPAVQKAKPAPVERANAKASPPAPPLKPDAAKPEKTKKS